ncbi:hypothetical protein GNI_003370 [Gregarina niphandrodes]|uniref:Uncharacterized protein n=1 Tax=Gregarina niphandrodes TaxID=110365 RepID=A0A023BDK3_GRENI|nr:hypothetical protein GNI_003370 [Gregarina niphandrodes]EZG89044.1 hypothetical protein GNI_003370 [Gregarina niphandrodes]|eukprot:XP_011128513.1 hypothetical protein GNI_003370 [Gregarina niphandrodes]
MSDYLLSDVRTSAPCKRLLPSPCRRLTDPTLHRQKKELDAGLDQILSRRDRKHHANGAQLRLLTNASHFTAYEVVALASAIGAPLSKLERSALHQEFEDRGGFTRDDIYFLIAPQITDAEVENKVRASLLKISGGKPTLKAKQLVHYLIRAGSTLKLTMDEISTFVTFCYTKMDTAAPIDPESDISIDIIVDL